VIRPSATRPAGCIISDPVSNARAEVLLAVSAACAEAVAANDAGAWDVGPVISGLNTMLAAAERGRADETSRELNQARNHIHELVRASTPSAVRAARRFLHGPEPPRRAKER
jgi:hypothetical protein